MLYKIELPNGSTQTTNSSESVVSTLKSYGVRGLNKKKPPVNLKEVGKANFEDSLGRTITVTVSR